MPVSLAHKYVIVCEGSADKAFFEHLIRVRGLPDCDVLEVQGRTNFGSYLRGLGANSRLKDVLGLLLLSDNDNDPGDAFQFVRNQVDSSDGFGVPNNPLELANPKRSEWPPIMVGMIPWVGTPGNLETLCLRAIGNDHPTTTECVDRFVECTGTTEWDPSSQSKLRLQCSLAALYKPDPNKALRWIFSVADCPIRLDHPQFDQIAGLLRQFVESVDQH